MSSASRVAAAWLHEFGLGLGVRVAGDIRWQAVFMMGLPASGKSFVKQRDYLKHTGFVNIDPDDIKQQHPDYDPERPWKVHEWSFEMAEGLFRKTIETGDPFVYDGTGTDPGKLGAKMQEARDAGYRIMLVYVYVPVSVAVFRNRNRERFVPEARILDKAERTDKSFGVVRKIADKVKVVPNFSPEEEQAAAHDLDLYPAPQAVRPPRPGEQGYGLAAAASANEEHSFVMFKPLAVAHGTVERMKHTLEQLGATFEECDRRRVNRHLMAKHYEEHSNRPFFKTLLDYYDGKVVEACRVGGEKGIILKIRRKMGGSDPLRCIPGEHLRAEAIPYAQSGESCGVDNFIHASDSPASARRELALWGLLPTGKEFRDEPADLQPGQRAVMASFNIAMRDWHELTEQDDPDILDQAARAVGYDIKAALRAADVPVLAIEVQRAADGGRTVWFLPDRASIIPIYLSPGDPTAYTARSGGTKGRPLGRGTDSIVEMLMHASV